MEDLKTFVKLGSITSRCSRNEPTLILEETAGRVTLALLISTYEKRVDLPESGRQHKLALNDLISTWWMRWIVYDRVIEQFKVENLKAVQWESLKKVG